MSELPIGDPKAMADWLDDVAPENSVGQDVLGPVAAMLRRLAKDNEELIFDSRCCATFDIDSKTWRCVLGHGHEGNHLVDKLRYYSYGETVAEGEGRFDPNTRPDHEIVAEIAGRIWAADQGAGTSSSIEVCVNDARGILSEARRQCAEGGA